jgi:hypothetical protein
MPNIKKIILAILIVSGIILLFTVSEIIYIYNNQPEKIANVFLMFAKKTANLGKADLTISLLNKYTNLTINQNRSYYHYLSPDTALDCNLKNLDSKTSSEIKDYVINFMPVTGDNKSVIRISNLYYRIGLIAYTSQFHATANCFFKNAIYLNPELSYLFIELANSYFNDNNYNKGINVLEYCDGFYYPKKHCAFYLENNVKDTAYDKVGTYKEFISKFQSVNPD